MLIPLAISTSVLSILSDGESDADDDKAARFRMVRSLSGPVEAWTMIFREMPDPGSARGAGLLKRTGGVGWRAVLEQEGRLGMMERQEPIVRLAAQARRAENLEALYGLLVELDAVLLAFDGTTPNHFIELDHVLSSRQLPQWSSPRQEGWVTTVEPFRYDVTVWSSYSDPSGTRRIIRLDPREPSTSWSRFRMVATSWHAAPS